MAAVVLVLVVEVVVLVVEVVVLPLELLELDLDDPDQRLALQLACRARLLD